MYMENAYVLRYGCNTCKTKNVKAHTFRIFNFFYDFYITLYKI